MWIPRTHVYDIPAVTHEPIFVRPPFVALVRANPHIYPWVLNNMPFFLLIGLHTKPTRTYSELHGLQIVYNMAVNDFNQIQFVNGALHGNALILGDLNAACTYFDHTDQLQKTLDAAHGFRWLIPNNMPTNVGASCAYDR